MLVWLENAYSCPFLGSFWDTFPPNDVAHRPNPKKSTILGLNHVIWAIIRENRSRGSSWACEREKKDRTGKKVTKGYILPVCGETPTKAMYMTFCLVGMFSTSSRVPSFQIKVRGYDSTGGRIFHFLTDFWMGLTTEQRYCAACDVTCNVHTSDCGLYVYDAKWWHQKMAKSQ